MRSYGSVGATFGAAETTLKSDRTLPRHLKKTREMIAKNCSQTKT